VEDAIGNIEEAGRSCRTDQGQRAQFGR